MNRTSGNPGEILVGLDIGTTKVSALVGEVSDEGELHVIGVGSHPSLGMKKGVVIDIESTVLSIQRAIEEAERQIGHKIHSVYAGIAGTHIKSMNSSGWVSVRDGEVKRIDIDRVIDSAQGGVSIPSDEHILHVESQEYTISSQTGIREPLGMSGNRLEAKVHVVTCAMDAKQNIEKCIKRCGLELRGLVLGQLASSEAVLAADERELGVCLVDIGGGTTDIAIFTQGALQCTGVIPVAGDQVTSDISVALRTPPHSADELKIKHASALQELVEADAVIQVPSVGERAPREMFLQNLAEVVGLRYEELFGLVQQQLEKSQMDGLLTAGIVMTGGSSMMPGAVELAEAVLNESVRIGKPQNVKGRADIIGNPAYSTGVGLLLYGLKALERNEEGRQPGQPIEKTGFLHRAKGFFRDHM